MRMNGKRTREASTSSEDDRDGNSTAAIGVGTGKKITPRPARMLLFYFPVFCADKGLQLYLCKELSESPEPPANATSGADAPPTQRPLPVPGPDVSRTTPRKGLRLGAEHPKGGSAKSLRYFLILRRLNHITGRHHENCQPNQNLTSLRCTVDHCQHFGGQGARPCGTST